MREILKIFIYMYNYASTFKCILWFLITIPYGHTFCISDLDGGGGGWNFLSIHIILIPRVQKLFARIRSRIMKNNNRGNEYSGDEKWFLNTHVVLRRSIRPTGNISSQLNILPCSVILNWFFFF
jgi:hypothetical protein